MTAFQHQRHLHMGRFIPENHPSARPDGSDNQPQTPGPQDALEDLHDELDLLTPGSPPYTLSLYNIMLHNIRHLSGSELHREMQQFNRLREAHLALLPSDCQTDHSQILTPPVMVGTFEITSLIFAPLIALTVALSLHFMFGTEALLALLSGVMVMLLSAALINRVLRQQRTNALARFTHELNSLIDETDAAENDHDQPDPQKPRT